MENLKIVVKAADMMRCVVQWPKEDAKMVFKKLREPSVKKEKESEKEAAVNDADDLVPWTKVFCLLFQM